MKNSKIIVLAIKPPQLQGVLHEIRDHLTEDHLILSVVAGATTESISKEINGHKRVSRMMPNTPAMLGAGAGAYSMASDASFEDTKTVDIFMNSVGIAFEVCESKMDPVTGLSGSGPAYVFIFIEALADGGVK